MNLKRRENIILLTALLCVAVFLLDRFVITPMASQYTARAAAIQKLRDDLNRGRYLIKRENQISLAVDKMINDSLPPDRPAVEKQMFEALQRWKNASGLAIAAISPRWDKDTGGDTPIPAKMDKLELRVSATGGIQSIARFLFELEHDPLAVRLEDVEITARDPKGQSLALETRITGLIISPEGRAR